MIHKNEKQKEKFSRLQIVCHVHVTHIFLFNVIHCNFHICLNVNVLTDAM